MHGNECISVGRYTLNEGNKRCDWMKHWLMFNNTQHSTRCTEKTPQKQTTSITPKGNEKQIDYTLTKRRYSRHTKDAGANDMIHMATFTITMPGKNIHYKNTRRKHDMIESKKNIEVGKPELEKRYQEIIEKKRPPQQIMPQRKQKMMK